MRLPEPCSVGSPCDRGGARVRFDQHEIPVRSRTTALPSLPSPHCDLGCAELDGTPREFRVENVPHWFRGTLKAEDGESVNDHPAGGADDRSPAGSTRPEHPELLACLGACQQHTSEQFERLQLFVEESVCGQLAAVHSSVRGIEELLLRQERHEQQQLQQEQKQAQQKQAHTNLPISGVPVGNTLVTLDNVFAQLQKCQEQRFSMLQEQAAEDLRKEAVQMMHQQQEAFQQQQHTFCEEIMRQRRSTNRLSVDWQSDVKSASSHDGSEPLPLRPETPSRKLLANQRRHPFVGKWQDHHGSFFRGQVINITNSGWRPGDTNPDDGTMYTRSVLSETHWQLHQTDADGCIVNFDVTQGMTDTLMVRSGDLEWVLKREKNRQVRSLQSTRARMTEELDEDWMMTRYTQDTEGLREARRFVDRQLQRCALFVGGLCSCSSRFQWVTKTHAYEIVRVASIVLDTIFLIWNVERAAYVAKHYAHESSSGIRDDMINIVLSDLFCMWFVTDLLLRVILEGRHFMHRNGKLFWLFFDFFVVVAYVMEVFAQHIYLNQRSYSQVRTVISQLSLFRVLRLLHLGHMSQVIRRHTVFRELRLLLYAVQGMLKSLLWSLVIVFFILLIFGIIFTEGALSFCVAHRALSDVSTAQLRDSFGTLSASMLTLFQAMSNGADWGGIYVSLDPLSWYYKLVFIFFIMFTFLALLNVVTAVFVESTMQRSLLDRETVVVDEMAARRVFIDSIVKLFHELDQDGSGTINFEEMKEYFKEPAVGIYFARLGVCANQIGRLFELLDRDSSGEIDLEEFMYGCQHLKGEAKSLDMAIIRQDIQVMLEGLTDMADTLDSCMLMVNRAMRVKNTKRTEEKA